MINMVFPALDPTIREKVISAYLTGHGRNQITLELNEQGLKVSTASVAKIIKGYEHQHQETLPNVATTTDISPERSEGLTLKDLQNLYSISCTRTTTRSFYIFLYSYYEFIYMPS